jgi:hypothetical protein
MPRYRDGSSIGSPMNADKTEDDDMGDVTTFASFMLVLCNKSLMYHC